MVEGKNNKKNIISFRLSDDEYADLLLKISDANGMQKLSASAFVRASLVSAQVRANDVELERYRVYIAGQIAQQINEIAGALNTANNEGVVSDNLVITLADKIDVITNEMHQLLAPLEGRTEWH